MGHSKNMKIENIEYIAPTEANQLGSIKFLVELPVIFKPGETKAVKDNSEVNAQLSSLTQELANQLGHSIIRDITR